LTLRWLVRENRPQGSTLPATRCLPVLLAASAIAFAQTAPPSGTGAEAANAVIRIDVNLVQVDAVVTDSHGRRVTNLPATAFELFQDGKPQQITNFAYVSTRAPAVAKTPAVKPVKGEPPPPPQILRPADVRRALALVVDDLGLAGENIPLVRNAIRNFIDEQMRPGDMVAIIRTGAGMGALQQFTTDKRLLYAALERIKYGESRVGVSSFAPLGSGTRGSASLDHFREQTMAVGTLAALSFVVNGMRDFPGRKSVILFTENVRMIYRGATDQMVASAVEELSDAASRASVVIHAIDPRGMPDYQVTPADDTSHISRRRLSRVPQQREQEVVDTEQGMFALSEKTGGLFLHDTNDLTSALRKAAEDSDGYYLIGYHPDAATFDNSGQPKFHRIEVKVQGAGLHVRSRDGFFGEPGSGNRPLEHTRQAELVHALQTPFSAGSIHPRLTAVFSNQPQVGSFINAYVYFPADELKWTGEGGTRKASVDLAAAAFDENGLALAPVDTNFALQFTSQQYDTAVKKGMVYGIHIPVTKPGPYLVRAALRDVATEGTGSAQQFVEVPDVANGRLALSGIVVQEAAAEAAATLPRAPSPAVDVTGGAARRSFRRGSAVFYYYEILNARSAAGQHPELEVQTRMFHNGTEVLDTKSMLDTTAIASDPHHLRARGRLSLGSGMSPGEYVLQVIVTDKAARSKFGTVTQSTDFAVEQ
jgi:VWFA-related protein